MPELQKHRNQKTIQPNLTELVGTITIGAAGAITTQTGQRNCGVTFVKNGTGRYDGTFHRAYRRLMGGNPAIIAAGVTAPVVNQAILGNVSVGSVAGTAGITTFAILCLNSAGALADPANGDMITFDLLVSDSP